MNKIIILISIFTILTSSTHAQLTNIKESEVPSNIKASFASDFYSNNKNKIYNTVNYLAEIQYEYDNTTKKYACIYVLNAKDPNVSFSTNAFQAYYWYKHDGTLSEIYYIFNYEYCDYLNVYQHPERKKLLDAWYSVIEEFINEYNLEQILKFEKGNTLESLLSPVYPKNVNNYNIAEIFITKGRKNDNLIVNFKEKQFGSIKLSYKLKHNKLFLSN